MTLPSLYISLVNFGDACEKVNLVVNECSYPFSCTATMRIFSTMALSNVNICFFALLRISSDTPKHPPDFLLLCPHCKSLKLLSVPRWVPSIYGHAFVSCMLLVINHYTSPYSVPSVINTPLVLLLGLRHPIWEVQCS